MEISDANKKKRRLRINYIDVILILVILIAAGILAFMFLANNSVIISSKKVYIEYEVSIPGIMSEFRGNVNVGDNVVDSVKLMPIGVVVDVKYDDTVNIVDNRETGELMYVNYPDHVDMTVRIRAEASLESGLYIIDGYHISVGTLVSMRVPNFTEQGYCTTIKEVV
jgi:hypothetical protein